MHRDLHRRAVLDLAGDKSAAQAGLDLPLEIPLQRARAVDRVVALLRDQLLRGGGDVDRDAPVREPVLVARPEGIPPRAGQAEGRVGAGLEGPDEPGQARGIVEDAVAVEDGDEFARPPCRP